MAKKRNKSDSEAARRSRRAVAQAQLQSDNAALEEQNKNLVQTVKQLREVHVAAGAKHAAYNTHRLENIAAGAAGQSGIHQGAGPPMIPGTRMLPGAETWGRGTPASGRAPAGFIGKQGRLFEMEPERLHDQPARQIDTPGYRLGQSRSSFKSKSGKAKVKPKVSPITGEQEHPDATAGRQRQANQERTSTGPSIEKKPKVKRGGPSKPGAGYQPQGKLFEDRVGAKPDDRAYEDAAETMQGSTEEADVKTPKGKGPTKGVKGSGIPPNPEAAKRGEKTSGSGQSDKIPEDRPRGSRSGPAAPKGGTNVNLNDPIAVRDAVASHAIDIYQQLRAQEGDSGRNDRSIQQEATRTALKDFEGVSGDFSKTTPGTVSGAAFGKTTSRESTSQKIKRQTDTGTGAPKGYRTLPSGELQPKASSDLKPLTKEQVARRKKTTRGISGRDDPNKLAAQTKAQQKITQEKQKSLKPGQVVPKAKITNQRFLRQASPTEKKWIDTQNEYGGLFYGAKGNKVPGAYRRWQQYVNARQVVGGDNPSGADLASITDWLTADNRGKTRTNPSVNPDRKYKDQSEKTVQAKYTGGIMKKEGTKPRDRYKSLAPSHEDFGVGIRVPGLSKKADLKDQNPDASDRQIFEMHESEKQTVDELMDNQKLSHEQAQSEILGRTKSETAAGPADRVVFLTTSTGYPAISTGASSLLGQYIIKKRKRMLNDQKMASRAQLKGEFPYAVRDQHVIEVASGLSIGAQGRYGAFRQIGYRAGAKKSKGYGKMLPVGSQILRDSSGQALYDRNGNLRYTEGFTRPFDLRPSNEVGMRIYLG